MNELPVARAAMSMALGLGLVLACMNSNADPAWDGKWFFIMLFLLQVATSRYAIANESRVYLVSSNDAYVSGTITSPEAAEWRMGTGGV